jgi:hypothetical protein
MGHLIKLSARETRIINLYWKTEQARTICAVMIGAELLELKAEVGHGQFEKRLLNGVFPFTKRTAEHYMLLAQKLAKRLGKNETVSFLNDEHATYNEFTEGKTLTQLYFDLGVMRRSRHESDVPASTANREETAWLRASHWLDEIKPMLRAADTFADALTPHEAKELEALLLAALRHLGSEAVSA